MNAGAEVAIKAAAANLVSARLSTALASGQLKFACAMTNLPEGSIDLLEDLATVQRILDRLQKQVDALAVGQTIPA